MTPKFKCLIHASVGKVSAALLKSQSLRKSSLVEIKKEGDGGGGGGVALETLIFREWRKCET